MGLGWGYAECRGLGLDVCWEIPHGIGFRLMTQKFLFREYFGMQEVYTWGTRGDTHRAGPLQTGHLGSVLRTSEMQSLRYKITLKSSFIE